MEGRSNRCFHWNCYTHTNDARSYLVAIAEKVYTIIQAQETEGGSKALSTNVTMLTRNLKADPDNEPSVFLIGKRLVRTGIAQLPPAFQKTKYGPRRWGINLGCIIVLRLCVI